MAALAVLVLLLASPPASLPQPPVIPPPKPLSIPIPSRPKYTPPPVPFWAIQPRKEEEFAAPSVPMPTGIDAPRIPPVKGFYLHATAHRTQRPGKCRTDATPYDLETIQTAEYWLYRSERGTVLYSSLTPFGACDPPERTVTVAPAKGRFPEPFRGGSVKCEGQVRCSRSRIQGFEAQCGTISGSFNGEELCLSVDRRARGLFLSSASWIDDFVGNQDFTVDKIDDHARIHPSVYAEQSGWTKVVEDPNTEAAKTDTPPPGVEE